jgi:hypothetical protein
MAAAHRAPAPQARPVAKRRAREPSAEPNEEGWQHVKRKKKHRVHLRVSRRPSWCSGKVLADLVGLCFNCFAKDHVARLCPNPSCSTDAEYEPPPICAPPTNSSTSPPPFAPSTPREPSPLPVGAPLRRPMVELCVIHHFKEMVEEEAALDLALVAVVGGSRPPVSIVAVEVWLHTQFGIPSADIVVRRYQPEDFLICFSFLDDMLRVLHNRPLANPPSP